jgi:hypothetical protein
MTEAGGAAIKRWVGEGQMPPLVLTLAIDDADLRQELLQYEEGAERDAFAVSALKIGILALRSARGRIDAERVREEGDRLLAALSQTLGQHQRDISQQIAANLKEYFDPQGGRFTERVDRLIRQDGELEQVLRRQLAGDNSELARTLASHIGASSPLMQVLDPRAESGVSASIGAAVSQTLTEQRDHILREFSLDNKEGALARLIGELNAHQKLTSGNLQERIQAMVGEFSLDREDSALSRLMGRVEAANRRISAEFSLDEQNSALARLRRELIEVFETLRLANANFQEQTLLKLNEMTARKAESLKSTRHGIDFEADLLARVVASCQGTGDIAAHVGPNVGSVRNSKKGDIVVKLGPEHVAADARIVIEAKEDDSYSVSRLLQELDEARKNREATIGIGVVSARTPLKDFAAPLQRWGSDIIVTWDAEDAASDVILAAALSVAKALCVQVKPPLAEAQDDFDAITRAVLAIEKRIGDLAEVEKQGGTISKAGDDIKRANERILDRVRIMRDDLTRQVKHLNAAVVSIREALADPSGVAG